MFRSFNGSESRVPDATYQKMPHIKFAFDWPGGIRGEDV